MTSDRPQPTPREALAPAVARAAHELLELWREHLPLDGTALAWTTEVEPEGVSDEQLEEHRYRTLITAAALPVAAELFAASSGSRVAISYPRSIDRPDEWAVHRLEHAGGPR